MSPALPRLRGFVALLLVCGLVGLATACPFCSRDGRTLSSEVQDAAFVVYGRLANPRVTPNADGTENASTELHLEEVLKPHDYLKGKKMVLLPRYLPLLDEKAPDKCIIFCHYFRGNVDPYLMFAVRDNHFLNYLRGSLGLGQKQEDRITRLKFFFDHLDSDNNEIAQDAYREFAFANYKEVRELIERHREPVRAKLLQWLQNRDAHMARLGLLGLMLGLSGKPEDAGVLRDALQDQQVVSGLDGMMAGYILLRQQEGWAFVNQVLRDRSSGFSRRHSAYRTVKFFLRDHPGFILEKEIWAAFDAMLEDRDLADIAMNELRHVGHWSHLDRVMALNQKEDLQTPIIQKAILQYLLRCPSEKAKQYVATLRQANPKRVQHAEEDLLYDQPPP